MRKINPAAIRADFASGIATNRAFFLSLEISISNETDKSLLASLVFLSSVVLWEGFVNDMFIAYLNIDSSGERSRLQAAITNHLTEEYGDFVASNTTVTLPAHIAKADVARLLDRSDKNITFRSGDDLKDGAKRHLSAIHQATFDALTARETKAITAWTKVRNCIAHRSVGSIKAMNEALIVQAMNAPVNRGLKRGHNKISNIGSWLKARPNPDADQRLIQYLDRMATIAAAI
jgi:hypothetical protein